ncbi:hypothetical protein [Rhizobium rhizogenes]|uniref:hypothetical protein n=1 Tax=Rhizobium rhizogenes TaxID=359 RepID=UPI002270CA9C|nr:hypothetical protein [Rhizobium rhizogenes]
MDKEYAREFRAFKAEIEDRVKRLEDAQKPLSEADPVPEPIVSTPAKKNASDAAQVDSAS